MDEFERQVQTQTEEENGMEKLLILNFVLALTHYSCGCSYIIRDIILYNRTTEEIDSYKLVYHFSVCMIVWLWDGSDLKLVRNSLVLVMV